MGEKLFCKAARYFKRAFKAKHGVTQCGPLPPTILNFMVDAVVRTWLMEVGGAMDFLDVQHPLVCLYTNSSLIMVHIPLPSSSGPSTPSESTLTA